MLGSLNLNDKTYEELLAEAIAQIPLYSREWTNFNVSDPGITMLQNLTAFQLLQQEEINELPEEVWRKLLKLVGYEARENHPATIYAQAPAEGGPYLPEGSQLWSGDLPYETEQPILLQPWGLRAVFAEGKEGAHDITRLLSPKTDSVACPFGSDPEEENALVCILSGTPEMGEPLYLWMQVAEEELRTPFGEDQEIPAFSSVKWQAYTENGWQDVRCKDETAGLLRSGLVTLWLEGDAPAKVRDYPVEGCALRCQLCSADYDRVPRLQSLAVHLFPLVQKSTRVRCLTMPGGETVRLEGDLAALGNYMVFCKEKPDGPYFPYYRDPSNGMIGRFYRDEETDLDVELTFTGGKLPWEGEDAVRVVCFDNDMIHHRLLGPVYGYDHQVVGLDLVENVVPEDFLLGLEYEQEGENCYAFLTPGQEGPDGFRYHVRSKSAEVVIDDPGRGGYQMLLSGCAVTQGARGNLHRGASLNSLGGYDGTEVLDTYSCPAPGRGGMNYETTEELRLRFSKGMQETAVAVRSSDYEALVHQTPGLCIHKVRAIADQQRNLVKIAVKPYTEHKLPTLSKAYLDQIQGYLEPRRMLTTRIEICQPRYVPVGVNAVLSIRGLASYAYEETERVLREALDYVNGPQNFGEWVRFHKLYQTLTALPFVDGVDGLSIYPENRNAVLVGSDIQPDEDCLCYPGTIHLTLREFGR